MNRGWCLACGTLGAFLLLDSGWAQPPPVSGVAQEAGQLLQPWVPFFSPAAPTQGPAPDPLSTAAAGGDEQQVRRLLSAGASPNGTGAGELPLAAAVQRGHTGVARLLLEAGADPNRLPPGPGDPVLHLAVRTRDLALVKLLLERGAAVGAVSQHEDRQNPDHAGDSALHEAAAFGVSRLCEQLVRAGADPNATNRRGLTPLHHAAGGGHVETAACLLDRGAQIDRQNRIGVTPLHWAVRHGQVGTARLLADRGASVNVASQHGSTPLNSAVARRDTEMVKLLLAAGADLGAVGMSGETPLNLARRLGASELVGLLETAAASPRPDEPGAPRTETSGRTAAGPGTSPVTLAGVVVLGVVLTALLLYFLLRRTAAKETSRLQRFVETLRGLGRRLGRHA